MFFLTLSSSSEVAALKEQLSEAELNVMAYKGVKDQMEQKAASLVGAM